MKSFVIIFMICFAAQIGRGETEPYYHILLGKYNKYSPGEIAQNDEIPLSEKIHIALELITEAGLWKDLVTSEDKMMQSYLAGLVKQYSEEALAKEINIYKIRELEDYRKLLSIELNKKTSESQKESVAEELNRSPTVVQGSSENRSVKPLNTEPTKIEHNQSPNHSVLASEWKGSVNEWKGSVKNSCAFGSVVIRRW